MSPYVFAGSLLMGACAFAAVGYFWLWCLSRHERLLLLFAVHCALVAARVGAYLLVATALTEGECQRALDLRATVGNVLPVSALWVMSLVSGLRARAFVWPMTAALLALAAVSLTGAPLEGTVLGIERLTWPWGEQSTVPLRGPPGWWVGPVGI